MASESSSLTMPHAMVEQCMDECNTWQVAIPTGRVPHVGLTRPVCRQTLCLGSSQHLRKNEKKRTNFTSRTSCWQCKHVCAKLDLDWLGHPEIDLTCMVAGHHPYVGWTARSGGAGLNIGLGSEVESLRFQFSRLGFGGLWVESWLWGLGP